jgi:site-specific DNA-adenine methylase
MAKYGIPWMGSKQSIADRIITLLPAADNFYDLFGGGFSITHAAILSKKYKTFHFNEIQDGVCDLVKDAIFGKYNYDVFKPKFISREEFFAKKDKDAYIRTIWSFGNCGSAYMFGKEVEPIKRSLHQAVVFGEFDEFSKKFFRFDKWETDNIRHRRLISRRIAGIKLRSGELQQLQRLQQLQQLEQLERLQQLQQLQQLERLERLERLEFSQKDYREIEVKDNSIIYLDPPYIGTKEYSNGSFDHKSFYDWVKNNKRPIFFSEYSAPNDFKCIAGIGKNSLFSSESRDRKFEKIFVNQSGYDLYKSKK